MKNTFDNKLAAAKSFHAVVLIVRKGKKNYVVNYSINQNTGLFVQRKHFTAKSNISDMTIVHYENSM
jgi:hypothetical protein